jgi:hypothetical protein
MEQVELSYWYTELVNDKYLELLFNDNLLQ